MTEPQFYYELYARNQICMTADSYAEWKGNLEKLCSLSGRCTFEEKKTIEMFFNRVNGYQATANVLKLPQTESRQTD